MISFLALPAIIIIIGIIIIRNNEVLACAD